MAIMTLTLLPVLLVMLLMLALAICVAVFVYKDAASRGMPGILWAAVALLVPGLVGLLIYLVVRGNYSALRCAACGGPVKEQYMVCPHCGAKLRQTCPHCGRPLEAGWQCCAGCGQPVPADSTQEPAVVPASAPSSRWLWVVLGIAAAVLVLFVLALVLLLFINTAV